MNVIVSSVYLNFIVVFIVKQFIELFIRDKFSIRRLGKLREQIEGRPVSLLIAASVIKNDYGIFQICKDVLMCGLYNIKHTPEYEVRAEYQYTYSSSERCRIIPFEHVADTGYVEKKGHCVADDQKPVIDLHIGVARPDRKHGCDHDSAHDLRIYRYHEDDIQESFCKYNVRKYTGIHESDSGIIERNILITPYACKDQNINDKYRYLDPAYNHDSAISEHEEHRHSGYERGSYILELECDHDLIKVIARHLEKITRILDERTKTADHYQLGNFRSLLNDQYGCTEKTEQHRYDL